MTVWEEIAAPAGSFIGWDAKPGQHVTGKVTTYAADGGTDFGGGRCPLLSIELTEPAASFNKMGERTDHPAGATVNITCGQVKLKQVVSTANPAVGDLIKVELTGVAKTASGNTLKEFTVKIARGAAPTTPAPAPATAPAADDDTPPF